MDGRPKCVAESARRYRRSHVRTEEVTQCDALERLDIIILLSVGMGRPIHTTMGSHRGGCVLTIVPNRLGVSNNIGTRDTAE